MYHGEVVLFDVNQELTHLAATHAPLSLELG